MEGYRGHTGSNVQDFEGCCILHWNFLKGSCGFWILSTVCRVILRTLDLVSGLSYGILGILDPVEPFCRRILWISDPVFLVTTRV